MADAPHIELQIRNLLLSRYSPREVLEQLIPRLYNEALSPQDRRTIFMFAWNSGAFHQIGEHIPELFRLRRLVPWSFFLEFLARAKLKPDEIVIEAIIKGARRQDEVADMVLSRSYDSVIPMLPEFRREVQRLQQEKRAALRKNLIDKLNFFRNENMTEEERRLIELLHKMYPNDGEIHRLRNEFQERWARHVVSKHSSPSEARFDWTLTDLDVEMGKSLEPAFKELKNVLSHRPDFRYEFSVAFSMMDLQEYSLQLLEDGAPDLACDWLKADSLLRSHRHIECLDHLSSLEIRYGQDPDTAFAITYYRAQALWGLKQPSRAMELLQSILAIRPNYRSAASLFKDWSGGMSP